MSLPERNTDGNLPAYAWPGGYPPFYLDREANVLCPKCANREIDASQTVTDCDVHWEGPALVCDDCGAEIESAYGDPDTTA